MIFQPMTRCNVFDIFKSSLSSLGLVFTPLLSNVSCIRFSAQVKLKLGHSIPLEGCIVLPFRISYHLLSFSLGILKWIHASAPGQKWIHCATYPLQRLAQTLLNVSTTCQTYILIHSFLTSALIALVSFDHKCVAYKSAFKLWLHVASLVVSLTLTKECKKIA